MPILQGIKRVNPLDLNKNVKIGVAFPLDDINMFEGTDTVKEQAKTNLINLLLTNKGERPMLPKYGIGLKKLLFENEIDTELLVERIRYQSLKYIPEISIQDARITTSEDNHTIFITIVYSLIADRSIDSIQLNFS
tara:strand:- start:1016 stop:1423 length:408 start_codon:yes stop_codon:yes gene_type:complete